MIHRTQRNFKRRVQTWTGMYRSSEKHAERVLRETWWVLWFIPLYVRDTIEATDI